MSKVFLLLGRTGDVTSILPFLKHEADAGEVPQLVVSNQHSNLLEGVSYVRPQVWDGGVHQLREAYDWAKAQFGEVRSLQVIGHKETVAECTYKPAGQESARMTSFAKEYWKLAGKMPLWDDVLPLVFDRRSPEREAKLIESCGLRKPGRKKPIILVSTSGMSSPFPHADLLWQLVWLKFKGRFNVMRLPQAERFYDLLALYERAHCLVTTDSAPLHLARACPDLPVMALTNDRPLLWNGSAWLPNWHWCCRYHDFPDRALELLEAIHTCRDKPQHPFIHVWNEYDGRRKPDRFTRDVLPVFPGACGRDSANVLKDQKRVPYLKDCLRMGLQRAKENEHVLLSRPETELNISPELCHRYDAFFCHRMEGRNGERQFVPVVDLFCARKSWWQTILPRIPDLYLGGDVYWQQVLFILFKKEGAIDLTGQCSREPVSVKRPINGVAKWVEHNQKVHAELAEKEGTPPRFPRVIDQVQFVPLQLKQLFRFGYNPTIMARGDRTVMAYRYHEGALSTKLAIAECNESGLIFSNRPLVLAGKSLEDPKFFLLGGRPHLSWVEANYPQDAKAVVKYGRYEDGTITNIVHPKLGRNDWSHTEKNWCFFERNGSLYCIYETSPTLRVFEVKGDTVTPLAETPGPKWPYGNLRGPTAPLMHEGKLLVFCHSTLDNEAWMPRRRYYIGACLLEPEPPFSQVAVSQRPILYGSEEDCLSNAERESCIHYKRNVVFVGGAIEADGYWIVAIGENDSACVLVKVRPQQLNFQ